ncbi:AAA family ATPase [Dactylosporangium sp. CA-092794]|uniref:AAA family ATPase n=1 Tax=Dactylosporangium sp. CA-092794 TaxID=3239929 RepID=UPI003D8DFF23
MVVDEASPSPRQVWLRSITVGGFRGVGPATRLPLDPGPGLTLVVGRNGSGKSSFAEGAEVALTGRNDRLTTSPAEWRKQWRNVHDGGNAEVAVELQVDGDSRHLTVRRRWTGKDIGDSVSAVEWDGVEQGGLSELGWDEDLDRYRPFLSYDDLGKVSGKPSTGFDRLIAVLGLEAITHAQNFLMEVRGELAKKVTAPREVFPELIKDLETIADDRARRALQALKANPPNMSAVHEALADQRDMGSDSARAVLNRLASLSAPDDSAVHAAAERLQVAAEAVEQVKGTDADDANQLAELLETAFAHHASHGDGPCPVCGKGALDAAWRERTTDQITRLRKRASAVTAARKALRDALSRAHRVIQAVPSELVRESPDGVDTAEAAAAWQAWAALTAEADGARLAAGLNGLLPQLMQSIAAVRDAATERLRRLEDAWRPFAGRLQRLLDLHTEAEQARPTHDDVAVALDWIKDEAERLRDLRLAPFRDQSSRIWSDLRQESNVDLGAIAFAGSGPTKRKLELPVRIDGVAGGVSMLSNGELHALGLALFLPRSTAPDSPFRFVVIDDPVQAMDPTKVEGLAKVLHETARHRQVVVFTHDDRLADALRRLMLPTYILEVVRREGSNVEIKPNLDPVRRYLADARQIARTDRLPEDLAAIATVGSCRDAIEAACQRTARRRLRAQNVSIREIDERLLKAQTTNHRVALAMLGDSRRTGQLMTALNRLVGEPWAADVLRDVREGAHHPRAELDRIINDSERLCDLIIQAGES